MNEAELRGSIAKALIAKLEPLLGKSKHDGGYDCCGCSTYDWILDDAVAVVLGGDPAKRER